MSLTILLAPELEALLRIIANAHPLVRRHRIAKLALRYGLRAIAEHPARLVEEARVLDVAAEEGGGR